eukprot:3651489-Rhodomonas_salina.2
MEGFNLVKAALIDRKQQLTAAPQVTLPPSPTIDRVSSVSWCSPLTLVCAELPALEQVPAVQPPHRHGHGLAGTPRTAPGWGLRYPPLTLRAVWDDRPRSAP